MTPGIGSGAGFSALVKIGFLGMYSTCGWLGRRLAGFRWSVFVVPFLGLHLAGTPQSQKWYTAKSFVFCTLDSGANYGTLKT